MRIEWRNNMDIKSYTNYRPPDNMHVLSFCVEISMSEVYQMLNDELYKEYVFKKYTCESENLFKSFIKHLLERK